MFSSCHLYIVVVGGGSSSSRPRGHVSSAIMWVGLIMWRRKYVKFLQGVCDCVCVFVCVCTVGEIEVDVRASLFSPVFERFCALRSNGTDR